MVVCNHSGHVLQKTLVFVAVVLSAIAAAAQPSTPRARIVPVKGTGSDYEKQGDGNDRPAIGEIRIVAFNFAPRGWANCDGQLLSIEGNRVLHGVLGTMHGGDGLTTFALPDLRGRTPIHIGEIPGGATIKQGQRFGGERAREQLDLERGQERAGSPPAVGLRFVIATEGIHPSFVEAGDMDAFPGEIRLFAGDARPNGWADCNGQELKISNNVELFAELGFAYGGDGKTTFCLPDLRGRIPVHEGDGVYGIRKGEMRGREMALGAKGEPSFTTRPCLGIRHMIALKGSKVRSASPLMGEIRIVPGNVIPRGWVGCNGQRCAVWDQTGLFSLLGLNYGGDGRSSFHLPDLRNRSAVHAGTSPGLDRVVQGQKIPSALGVIDKDVEAAENLPDTVPTQPYLGVRYIIAPWGLFPSRS